MTLQAAGSTDHGASVIMDVFGSYVLEQRFRSNNSVTPTAAVGVAPNCLDLVAF